MDENKEFAIEFLRSLIRAFGDVREDFNMRWDIKQLVAIRHAWLASGWDIYPDQWTETQVQAALKGVPPQWDENEQPIEPEPG